MKKDPLIHFPFYCNQYMGMLSKYTYEEQGAFLRVVCGCITEDGVLANDDSKYRTLSAFSESERSAVDKVFEDAFCMATEIMESQKAKRTVNRNNGKKGGRPKKK